MSFAVCDSTGAVLRTCPEEPDARGIRDGEVAVEFQGSHQWPAQPHPWTRLEVSQSGLQWADTRTLDAAKAQAWERIKAARAAAETAPLTVEGRTFDATDISQRQIAGAVQLALIAGPTFTVDWTLADNTSATLTQAEIIAVGVALGQRTAAVYSTGRGLRAQIESAITVDQVDSISWPSE